MGGSKKEFIKALNMDDFISGEARLMYTLECLLFELEKNDVSRNKAI